MGAGVLIGAIMAMIILICSPISYFILKYLGYKRTGIFISVFLALIVLIPLFFLIFESKLYSKSDAEKDLKLIDIQLKDDFEIIRSEISGMPEYYQFTDLKISDQDKEIIIKDIKVSDNFEKRDSIQPIRFMVLEKDLYRADTTILHNYKYKNMFIRELYIKRFNHVPINLRVEASQNSDMLYLERIED